ncbi:MAG: hypothetical protein IJQ40_01455 [Bacilli bacterium]|nr:hypothetical protein [Bacilli bacterium]MDY6276538.1 hypothetical protein [Bacilli bacterium]
MENLIIYGDASKNSFNEWLGSYGLYIAIGLAGAVFLTVLGLFLYTYFKGKKQGPIIKAPERKVIQNEEALKALGGAENILDHSLNGSRVILVLNNYDLVDDKALKEMGVSSIVKMTNKITLVVKGDASSFYKSLF